MSIIYTFAYIINKQWEDKPEMLKVNSYLHGVGETRSRS